MAAAASVNVVKGVEPESAAARQARIDASIKAGYAPLKPQYAVGADRAHVRAAGVAPATASGAAAVAAAAPAAPKPVAAAVAAPASPAAGARRPAAAATAAGAAAAAAPKSNVSFAAAPAAAPKSNVSFANAAPAAAAVAGSAGAAPAPAAAVALAGDKVGHKRARDDADGAADAKGDGAAAAGADASAVTGAGGADGESKRAAKKQRKRGQNKNRDTYKSARSAADGTYCYGVLSGEGCPKAAAGEACTFSHDVSAYLAGKPADLGDKCYVWDVRGKCRAGFCCRFAGAHIRDGALVVETRDPQVLARTAPDELNIVNKELLKPLSRNRYTFTFVDTLKRASESYKGSAQKLNSEQQKVAANAAGVGGGVSFAGNAAAAAAASAGAPAAAAAVVRPAAAAAAKLSQAERVARAFQISDRKEDEAVGCLVELERKPLDLRDKLYLAPLTTVGNLPYRRVCRGFGVDVTCGEMAMSQNIIRGQQQEWALMKRHPSEPLFGIQIAGAHVDNVAGACELINEQFVKPYQSQAFGVGGPHHMQGVDFVDLNCGCPIDLVCDKQMGCMLMDRPKRLQALLRTMTSVLDCPATMKMRTGLTEKQLNSIALLPYIKHSGIAAVTLHGRTRKQRYSRLADWEWVKKCAATAKALDLPLVGNGDVYTFEDYYEHMEQAGTTTCMIARGALIKPWLFTEIKERRHWDISSAERLEMLKQFVNFGLEHWGSDSRGVDLTRHFLLEWLSFLYRYTPVGCLETARVRMNWKTARFMGRDDLETLMASPNAADWVRLTELCGLGKVPADYAFTPKHRANAYENDSADIANG